MLLGQIKRTLAAGTPIALSLLISVALYRLYPPSFTGNACAGASTVVDGHEILSYCGIFPFGILVPIMGAAVGIGMWLSYRGREQ